MKQLKRYQEAVKYLESLPSLKNGGFNPSRTKEPYAYLRRTRWILEHLGNPDEGMRIIHVTGTSGKGSVSSMLANILQKDGKKTGLFTSPFSTTSVEKIMANGKFVAPNEFTDLVKKIKPIVAKAEKECPWGTPTYFELFFAIAILHFNRQGCEWAVLEVGCGGRFDATNAVCSKEVAVITNIDLDHTHIVGDTLEKIAYEKAGIIKPNCTFFTSEQRKELREIFQRECDKSGAKFEKLDELIKLVGFQNTGMHIKLKNYEKEFKTSFFGEHQIINMNLAASVARHLEVSDESIVFGLKNAFLPCRFELIQNNPCVILDGAHNSAKLNSTIKNLAHIDFEKLFIVFGVGERKQAQEMIRMVASIEYSMEYTLIATEFDYGESLAAEKIAQIAKKFSNGKMDVFCISDKFEALKHALVNAGPNDLVLITGSFYLAGELRKKWISEKDILTSLSCHARERLRSEAN